MNFDHRTLGQRVILGTHRAADHLEWVVSEYGAQSVMLIASASQREVARTLTANLTIAVEYTDVVMHVPIEVAQHARDTAAAHAVDLIITVGGGSTTGLAKAIALTTGTPIIAVPTTYSGSEATNMWGITEHDRKITGIDDTVLPKVVIYDAALTLDLPVELSVASGLNGLAHCLDSLWAPGANPINAALAIEGIRALATGLPAIVADPAAIQGREQTLYGGYLAAVAFASAGAGLHHKICHVLGGTFNLPHAQTHATVLPYVLAFNQGAAPQAAQRISEALGSHDALVGLQDLRSQLGPPAALADYGYAVGDISTTVEILLENLPAGNPREVTSESLTALLQAALTGADPRTLVSSSPRD